MSLESVTSTIEEEELEFVRFEFSDFYGISRCKIIPARHFVDKASNGIGIPICHLTCSIDCVDFQTETMGDGDAIWFPDFNTFRILPWYRKTASILLEPKYYKGELLSCYPRYIARRQLERLEKLGVSLLAAHEHEFHVVDQKTQKPLTSDMSLRSTVRTYTDPNLLDQLMTNLYKVGIDVENCETETGHGQMEITYKPAFGIQAADNAHVFKTSVKEIAQQHGYIASFMSKPSADHIGSSAHFCHSLWDKDGKNNLLYDVNAPNKLSELGGYWMAGILKHSPAITMLMAPTVNCYKRYGKQSYVSLASNWGIDKRYCLLRLKINGAKGTYVEDRSSGGGSNPYLTLAAIVAAGIDGIEKKCLFRKKKPKTPSQTAIPLRMAYHVLCRKR
ncbi:lengsin-like [Amphiura filiformis]|uniref:lengsin-like n=1 Tax=Amphiura filiformis TaxID=82378 RepID=UPI003B214515